MKLTCAISGNLMAQDLSLSQYLYLINFCNDHSIYVCLILSKIEKGKIYNSYFIQVCNYDTIKKI